MCYCHLVSSKEKSKQTRGAELEAASGNSLHARHRFPLHPTFPKTQLALQSFAPTAAELQGWDGQVVPVQKRDPCCPHQLHQWPCTPVPREWCYCHDHTTAWGFLCRVKQWGGDQLPKRKEILQPRAQIQDFWTANSGWYFQLPHTVTKLLTKQKIMSNLQSCL